MSCTKKIKILQVLVSKLTKAARTPKDLNNLSAFLIKLNVETALKVEMDHHLGYDKNDLSIHHNGTSRNGCSSNKLKGDHSVVKIQTPRDRYVMLEA